MVILRLYSNVSKCFGTLHMYTPTQILRSRGTVSVNQRKPRRKINARISHHTVSVPNQHRGATVLQAVISYCASFP